MTTLLHVLAALLIVQGAAATHDRQASGQKADPAVRVVMQTELGDIEIEIDAARAPLTAANFLRYVDAQKYDGGRFHRTVKPDNQKEKAIPIAVIQGASSANSPADLYPAIPLERTSLSGLRHRDGTLSMARAGVDTATDQFFICVGDQPELDFGGRRNPDGQGFAAFGRVVRGMDVVRKIQMAPAAGEALTPPIGILRVRRVFPASSFQLPASSSQRGAPPVGTAGSATLKSPC